jgi:hypothetical protein
MTGLIGASGEDFSTLSFPVAGMTFLRAPAIGTDDR